MRGGPAPAAHDRLQCSVPAPAHATLGRPPRLTYPPAAASHVASSSHEHTLAVPLALLAALVVAWALGAGPAGGAGPRRQPARQHPEQARPRAVAGGRRRAARAPRARDRARGGDPRAARRRRAGATSRRRRRSSTAPSRAATARGRARCACARGWRSRASSSPSCCASATPAGGRTSLTVVLEADGFAQPARDRRLPQAHPALGPEDPRRRAQRAPRRARPAARADAPVGASAARAADVGAPPPRRAGDDRRRAARAARGARAGARRRARPRCAARRRGRRRRRARARRACSRSATARSARSGRAGRGRSRGSIVQCESGGQNLPPNYAAASGYYQFITGDLARPRRLDAARLPGVEGRAGPPRGAAVGRRARRAQLGLRRARRHRLSAGATGVACSRTYSLDVILAPSSHVHRRRSSATLVAGATAAGAAAGRRPGPVRRARRLLHRGAARAQPDRHAARLRALGSQLPVARRARRSASRRSPTSAARRP